ncbi:hypothetical protein MKW98_032684 [Papaver atlanticum]|uniref:Polyphenol oxidase C-terminal domain-containing protein n=1 Tax=Papaver atlanticum TaxID=357466 RepID=A0AAD4SUP7_9MAGN|nr:hypothetical protein MKW98_032684 [Papaver atlanticum]
MSFSKPTTSGFSSSTSTFLPHKKSNFLLTKSSTNTSTTFFNDQKKPHYSKIWCKQKQNSRQELPSKSDATSRRNLVAGLGSLTVAAGLTTLTLMANGSPPTKQGSSSSTPKPDHDHQLIKIKEFGSQTRKLETPIRALVTKPKIYKSEKGKGSYVLIIEGIDVLNDEPVRFDVFVAKPQAGGDQAGPEFGEFAGSLVDLARPRSGRNSTAKGSLELGISCLLKEIGATDSPKLVVTLKPRSGEVSVSGVRVEYIYHED